MGTSRIGSSQIVTLKYGTPNGVSVLWYTFTWGAIRFRCVACFFHVIKKYMTITPANETRIVETAPKRRYSKKPRA